MKATILFISMLVFSVSAYAREPKAAVFGDLAKSTVQSMYGRGGDVVALKLVDFKNTDIALAETWEVSLSNGAAVGSALYEVEVIQNIDDINEGDQVASIKVKYLSGN